MDLHRFEELLEAEREGQLDARERAELERACRSNETLRKMREQDGRLEAFFHQLEKPVVPQTLHAGILERIGTAEKNGEPGIELVEESNAAAVLPFSPVVESDPQPATEPRAAVVYRPQPPRPSLLERLFGAPAFQFGLGFAVIAFIAIPAAILFTNSNDADQSAMVAAVDAPAGLDEQAVAAGTGQADPATVTTELSSPDFAGTAAVTPKPTPRDQMVASARYIEVTERPVPYDHEEPRRFPDLEQKREAVEENFSRRESFGSIVQSNGNKPPEHKLPGSSGRKREVTTTAELREALAASASDEGDKAEEVRPQVPVSIFDEVQQATGPSDERQRGGREVARVPSNGGTRALQNGASENKTRTQREQLLDVEREIFRNDGTIITRVQQAQVLRLKFNIPADRLNAFQKYMEKVGLSRSASEAQVVRNPGRYYLKTVGAGNPLEVNLIVSPSAAD